MEVFFKDKSSAKKFFTDLHEGKLSINEYSKFRILVTNYINEFF